jgi:hypothetical protein
MKIILNETNENYIEIQKVREAIDILKQECLVDISIYFQEKRDILDELLKRLHL